MKRSKVSGIAVILFLSLCFGASASFAQSRRTSTARPAQPPPPPLENLPPGVHLDVSGKFNGLVYTNAALGFTLTLPPGWQVQDTGVQQQFADTVNEKVEQATSSRSAVQASMSRTTLLFIAIKTMDAPINPTIISMTEDIRLAFNIRTPRQYLEKMRSVPIETPVAFEEEITTEQINGAEFGVLAAAPKNPKVAVSPTVRQFYYVMIRKNYAVGFILTYDGPEQLRLCMEALKSLKLH